MLVTSWRTCNYWHLFSPMACSYFVLCSIERLISHPMHDTGTVIYAVSCEIGVTKLAILIYQIPEILGWGSKQV